MKALPFLFVLFISALGLAQLQMDSKYATHPTPTQPVYISANWAETLKSEIPPFPEKNSAEQKKDEQILANYQTTRKTQDCERAVLEVHASLANFYGAPNGSLTDAQVKTLGDFFQKVRNEGDYFTHEVKNKYSRPRPFVYLKQLHPCVDLEKSPAYPSGHASLSELYALVLSEIFPAQKTVFLARAKQIRDDRVLAGVHHPSDINSGEKAGELIFAELMKSEAFKKDLAAAKKLVAN
jgi:acid phosphatase (class A)